MSESTAGGAQPDWEQVLSAAARLQALLPEAVLSAERRPECTRGTEPLMTPTTC